MTVAVADVLYCQRHGIPAPVVEALTAAGFGTMGAGIRCPHSEAERLALSAGVKRLKPFAA